MRTTTILGSLALVGALVAPRLVPLPMVAVEEPPDDRSCEVPPVRTPAPERPSGLPLLGAWVWDGCTLAPADPMRDAGRWDLHVRTGFVPDAQLPELLAALDLAGLPGVHLGFYTRPRSLEPLRRWDDLRYLTFEGDHLTDEAMAPLAELRELEMLEIGVRPYESNGVTDAGLRHLSGLRELRYLGLHAFDGVSGEGLRWLSGLTELRDLELSGTSVGDEGLRHLLPLAQLRTLSLADTEVTDAGVRLLAGLPELRTLDLRGTRVTPAIARELVRFPKLEHVVLHYNRQWDVIEAVRAVGLRADSEGWIRGTVGCERWPRA